MDVQKVHTHTHTHTHIYIYSNKYNRVSNLLPQINEDLFKVLGTQCHSGGWLVGWLVGF